MQRNWDRFRLLVLLALELRLLLLRLRLGLIIIWLRLRLLLLWGRETNLLRTWLRHWRLLREVLRLWLLRLGLRVLSTVLELLLLLWLWLWLSLLVHNTRWLRLRLRLWLVVLMLVVLLMLLMLLELWLRLGRRWWRWLSTVLLRRGRRKSLLSKVLRLLMLLHKWLSLRWWWRLMMILMLLSRHIILMMELLLLLLLRLRWWLMLRYRWLRLIVLPHRTIVLLLHKLLVLLEEHVRLGALVDRVLGQRNDRLRHRLTLRLGHLMARLVLVLHAERDADATVAVVLLRVRVDHRPQRRRLERWAGRYDDRLLGRILLLLALVRDGLDGRQRIVQHELPVRLVLVVLHVEHLHLLLLALLLRQDGLGVEWQRIVALLDDDLDDRLRRLDVVRMHYRWQRLEAADAVAAVTFESCKNRAQYITQFKDS